MSAAPAREDFGRNLPDRQPLSAHFARKAKSDLGMAQAMAMLNMPGRSLASDEPGLVLGTCMHLAQQSMEKTLKSIVFQLYEILHGSYGYDDDPDDTMPRSLGHSIYPEICGRYFSLLDHLRATDIMRGCKYTDALDNNLVRDTTRRKITLDQLDKLWKDQSKNSQLQKIAWKHSVGIRLEEGEFQTLESKHKPYAELLASSTCRPGMEPAHFSLDLIIPEISPEECLDAKTLKRRRDEHSGSLPASGLSATLNREFSECRIGVRELTSDPAHNEIYIRTARRAILEFGFLLLLYHFRPYMITLPHSTMGRYPRLLDNVHITTELYDRQAAHVLHYLFIGVPHSVEQLSDYSGRIGALWDEVTGSGPA